MLSRKSVLYGAEVCVCKDRESEYGTPENNFKAISNLWEDYLTAKYHKPITLTPDDVGLMMALLKIARIATGTAKEDSFIDAVGYIACAAEIATQNK